MLIPKDSTIVIPSYAIQRAERYGYDNPDEYNPDRFLKHTRLADYYAGSQDFNNRDKCFLLPTVCFSLAYMISVHITMVSVQ